MNDKYPKFSVLLSLYIKEKAEYFDLCMKSITIDQSVKPSEVVIVYDGPITKELEDVVKKYDNLFPKLIKVVINIKNKGLGLALAEGIKHCSYELIARMDTDDISKKDRFKKQLLEFMNDPNLDLCGSHIVEFSDNLTQITGKRMVPITQKEIEKYQKKRSAFNHVTVMFKKSKVISSGNYEDCLYMEDDMLWVRMLIYGIKCKNIDDYLVYVRAGNEMIQRRGGWKYFQNYKNGRKKIYDTGYISYFDYMITIIIQFIVALVPDKIRIFIFNKMLRKK